MSYILFSFVHIFLGESDALPRSTDLTRPSPTTYAILMDVVKLVKMVWQKLIKIVWQKLRLSDER